MQRIILSSIKSRGTLKTICDVNILLGNAIKHIFSYPLKYSSWLFTASKYVFSLSKTWFFKLLRYLFTPRNLSIQIFNLNIQVSLALKLVVQVTLALTYGTLFNLVLHTYVISQPTPVTNLGLL